MGRRILVTGVGGQVAFPLARSLAAAGDEVWGMARLRKPADRERLEAVGIRPFAADLAEAQFGDLPRDFDQVLNFAVAKAGKWSRDLAANAEGLGLLMAHAATAARCCTARRRRCTRRPVSRRGTRMRRSATITPRCRPTTSRRSRPRRSRDSSRAPAASPPRRGLNVPYGDGGWPRSIAPVPDQPTR
jgi:NAD(P)-dependent dehydrogenase (short-subunit alcohol dehydrogenase family)